MPDAAVDYLHLDVYLRSDPFTRVDTVSNYLEVACTDEMKGPGGGSFTIQADDPKLVANQASWFKHRTLYKVRRNETNIGAFILQTRDLTSADSDEYSSRSWQVSGEGLRGWFRDATVLPENGSLKKYTPDNRAFNFSCLNKSRWYANSTWSTPAKLAKVLAPGSPYGTRPANWPTELASNAQWVWGTSGDGESTTSRNLMAIANVTIAEMAVEKSLASANKDTGATKINKTTIQNDFSELRVKMATMKKAIVPVLADLTGGLDKAWRAVSSNIDDADDACNTANNTNATSSQWASAIKAVNKVVSSYDDASVKAVASPTQAVGDCYFRCEFNAPAAQGYTFCLAANNTIDAYIDGQLVLSMPDGADTYSNTQTVQQDLDAGNHVFAVKVTNTTKGIAGLIAYIYQDGTPATGSKAAVDAVEISVTGDSKWKVCAYPATPPGWTAGEIMLQLLAEAKSRGVLFPNWVKPTFTEDVDSAGVAWTRSGEFGFSVGTEYFDVLDALEAAGGDVYINPDTYAFNMYGSRGTNRSGVNLTNFTQDTSQLNPVVLRIGKNLAQAENSVTGQIKNSLVVKTADGWMTTTSPPDSEIGVIEGSYQSNQKTSGSKTIGALALEQFSTPNTTSTYLIIPLSDLVPYRDFNAGDWVQAPGDDGIMTARRVMSVSTAVDSAVGIATYTVEFDTIQQDRLTVVERRLDKLMNTGTTIGSSLTSTTSVNLPSTVSGGVPGTPPQGINAPTGLTGESTAYYTTDGQPRSSIALTWNPVVSSADGSIAQNVSYYEVWGSVTGDPISMLAATSNTNYTLNDLDLDVSYTFRVRARSSDGGAFSPYSDPFEITTAIPLDELDQPSPPTVTSKLGVFTVTWDGNLVSDDGTQHGADARLSQVRLEIGSLQDMSDATYYGQPLSNSGATVIPGMVDGQTYYFRFVAVDTFGLVSQPSAVTTAVLQGIELTDLPAAVGTITQNAATILYQPTAPGSAFQNATTTWYDTSQGYAPKRWDGTAWAPIMFGLQDDGSGTAIYSFIQTGAIAANAVSALQLQAKAVTAEKIDVGAVQAQHIQLGNYIPSGYGTDRVPGPLLDNVNWQNKWNAITTTNLNPENVQYTSEGVLMSPDNTNRSLWSATPMEVPPTSGKIVIDWIASNRATQVWIRLNTATNSNGWWQAYSANGVQAKSDFGHLDFDFNNYQGLTGRTDGPVTQYAVYLVLDPGAGTSLVKSISVNEVTADYVNMQSVQITQAGIFMNDGNGSTLMSLSPSNKQFLTYNNENTGGSVALDQNGNGSFGGNVSAQNVNASQSVTVDQNNMWTGNSLMVRGNDLLGTMDDDGTIYNYQLRDGSFMPWLDRFSRNAVYRAYWREPDGRDGNPNHYTFNHAYERLGSGRFTLEAGRQYTFIVNNRNLQMGGSDSATMPANMYFDLMINFSDTGSVISGNSGARLMRAVVYRGDSGNWVHSPATFAAVEGAGLDAGTLAQGIIPGNVELFWQYGLSMSVQPSAAIPVSSFGTGQGLTILDTGPGFPTFGSANNANSTAYADLSSGGTSTGGGSSSGGGSPSTRTITKTTQYAASWSRSWNQNGGGVVSGSGTYTDANMLYQGHGASAMGSMVGFPSLGLPSGASVSKVQLYLRNRHFYFNAGGDAIIGHHSQGSTPGSFSSGDSYNVHWDYGDGKWITLPGAWNNNWQSGGYRGISLGISDSTSNYAYFDGNNKSDQPQLKVTYTYKA